MKWMCAVCSTRPPRTVGSLCTASPELRTCRAFIEGDAPKLYVTLHGESNADEHAPSRIVCGAHRFTSRARAQPLAPRYKVQVGPNQHQHTAAAPDLLRWRHGVSSVHHSGARGELGCRGREAPAAYRRTCVPRGRACSARQENGEDERLVLLPSPTLSPQPTHPSTQPPNAKRRPTRPRLRPPRAAPPPRKWRTTAAAASGSGC